MPRNLQCWKWGFCCMRDNGLDQRRSCIPAVELVKFERARDVDPMYSKIYINRNIWGIHWSLDSQSSVSPGYPHVPGKTRCSYPNACNSTRSWTQCCSENENQFISGFPTWAHQPCACSTKQNDYTTYHQTCRHAMGRMDVHQNSSGCVHFLNSFDCMPWLMGCTNSVGRWAENGNLDI